MNLIRNLAAPLVVVLGVFATDAAMAAAETNVSSGLTLEGEALAVHGYDVVAYFTEGKPVRGRSKHSTVYKNATYRFASKEHLKAFEKNPTQYVPQFGGYCAYGVAVGAKFDGDPHLWRIVGGKLYFNLNEEIQQTWEKDIPGNIRKANRNWVEIVHKTPRELS